ncbi:MAG: DUF4190 domain-containing protein [Ruaniaceae bacterium]|nr:DUF4190 domain-containing protein [Ruaniaceae bacterium]
MTSEPTYPLSYVPVDTTAPRTVGADYLPSPSAPSVAPPFVFPGTEEVDPAFVFSGPGYRSPAPPYSLAARISLALAVLGVIPGISIGAIAAGHYALFEVSRSRKSGRGLAVAALALGYMGLAVWILIWILVIANG